MSKFIEGQSGNPEGRPKGALSKRTQLGKLLEPRAEELINKVITLAMEGDINALKICIERILPKPKEALVGFELPEGDLSQASTLLKLGAKTIQAVADGELTIDQSQRIGSEIIKTANLEQEIESIKKVLKID